MCAITNNHEYFDGSKFSTTNISTAKNVKTNIGLSYSTTMRVSKHFKRPGYAQS
jgi:hypothetical protein